MGSMKVVLFIIIVILFSFVGSQVYFILKERNQLRAEVLGLNGKLNTLQSENKTLKEDISYFSNPLNLEKELKAKFNYKDPGEKMIIVVP